MSTSISYRTTLGLPGVKKRLLLGILCRLPAGIVPFAVLVSFTQHYDIHIAGLASGALMLAIGMLAPTRARWCSSRGPRALVLMALVSMSFLVAAAAASGRWPWQAAVLLTAAGGALLPPLSPTLRATWSRLVPGRKELQSIHALDSTVEELTFIVTPLLCAVAFSLGDPRWALTGGALLLSLAASGLGRVLAELPDSTDPALTSTESQAAPRSRQRSIIRTRVGRGIVTPIIALGLGGGGLGVVITAAGAHHGSFALSGYSFAASSLGGLVGGLMYGRRQWAGEIAVRYAVATGGIAIGALLVSLTVTSPVLVVAAFCSGLPMGPLFIMGYLLIDERLESSRRPEANAWLGSGFNLGSATGAILAGQLLTLWTPQGVAITFAAPALIAMVLAIRSRETGINEKNQQDFEKPDVLER
ncbi:MFS transporter [Nocardia sp. NPDC019255]|uniref:MFS transporter n=1 Tax=Nocardia sp. NPDC019255 TaxID=3154591 RepID=UPI0033CC1EF9